VTDPFCGCQACRCRDLEAENERLRARATTGYDFVSLQRDEMTAERDRLRVENRRLEDIIVRASRLAESERAALTQRVLRELRP
jgi:hypothetical protein